MLPKKHKVWTVLKYEGKVYYTTAPETDRSTYSMYREEPDGKHTLLGTAKSPIDLEKRLYAGKYDLKNS